MSITLDTLRQHQLVILRRLRKGPLTEFELAGEVAASSGYTDEQAADSMADWLKDLQQEGLVWAGTLANERGQQIMAAALTSRGREVVRGGRGLVTDGSTAAI